MGKPWTRIIGVEREDERIRLLHPVGLLLTVVVFVIGMVIFIYCGLKEFVEYIRNDVRIW